MLGLHKFSWQTSSTDPVKILNIFLFLAVSLAFIGPAHFSPLEKPPNAAFGSERAGIAIVAPAIGGL